MKKSAIVFLLFSFLLTSCGAKKNVVTNVESAPVETEQSENITKADTLPEFLREFANDSTIHINWAYGIPFIIDDSVPMLLPPIDKTPEGYVSNRNFTQHFPEIRTFTPSNTTIEEIALVDSLLWLNKCLNEIYPYLQIETEDVQLGHQFGYAAYVYPLTESDAIIIKVSQYPYWPCLCRAITRDQEICYCFDIKGNLLGKYLTKQSECREGAKTYSRAPHYLGKTILNFQRCRRLVSLGMYNFKDDCCTH